MFGEKTIVGHTILKVQKDRIILPKFTFAEPGETISSTIDPYHHKLILLQEKELLERLNTYKEKLDLARQEQRISYSEYHNLIRYFYGMLPLHDRILNKELQFQLFNRQKVASFELKQLERLNLRDEVFAVGVGTTLEIYPSEQAYHEDLEFQKSRQKK